MNIRESDGDVSVTSIKDNNKWIEAKSISEVLKSLFVIFKRPDPGSPYKLNMANVYNINCKQY